MVNCSRRQQRRRQRGGAGESLLQGEGYQKFHMNQHGGFRQLDFAPVGHTGELDPSLRGGARLEEYDAHFRAAQAQSGGSRRRRRRQRGGALSPADVSSSYTLLPSSPSYTVTDGDRMTSPHSAMSPVTMKGGDRMTSPHSAMSPVTMKGGERMSSPHSTMSPASMKGGERMTSPHSTMSPASMNGGRRKSQKRRKNNRRKNNSRKNNSRKNKSRRQRGGFSPVGSPTMLLSASEYDKAGLNNEF